MSTTWFGKVALTLFLLMQCLDGLLAYLGVTTFGIDVEGNPIVAALMAEMGHGLGLLGAKIAAAVLGVCLHLHQIHSVVALLAGFYLTAAVAPWMLLLFF